MRFNRNKSQYCVLLLLSFGLLWAGCKEERSVITTRISIKDCLTPTTGERNIYNQCAEQNALDPLEALRGCFVWKSGTGIGWSTLIYQDNWTLDPSQRSSELGEDEQIIEAAFFLVNEALTCDRLVPTTECQTQPDCLVKLGDGPLFTESESIINFKNEDGVCISENRLPSSIQACVNAHDQDQYPPFDVGQQGLDLGVIDAGLPLLDASQNPDCSDGLLNGDETDIDCGGPCKPCAQASRCRDSSDCLSNLCQEQICINRACDDGVQNGLESHIDCGGYCEPCGDGGACNAATDCLAGVCTNNTCRPPSCNDGVLNGEESGTDCGGICPDCVDCSAEVPCEAGKVCIFSQCSAPRANGQVCFVDSHCLSSHCQNGFCCGNGDCCSVASDCPNRFSSSSSCVNASSCQGTRLDAICTSFQCDSRETDDDSGCNGQTAENCGAYAMTVCTSEPNQSRPQCATSCSRDDDCNVGLYCISGACQSRVPNGNACSQDNQCESGHCENGYCCDSGICCASPANCPAPFSAGPTCTNTATCAGTRTDATCQASQCGSTDVGDDSGCAGQVSSGCGLYPSVSCTNEQDQPAPQCATSCVNDNGCDSGASCISNRCEAERVDGTACTQDNQCSSGHCQNGYCCSTGDCCNTASACPAQYSSGPRCIDATNCQGSRTDATCQSSRCGSVDVADDRGCSGQVANTCGPYLSVTCGDQNNQTAPQCATSCTSNAQCDTNLICVSGSCQSALPNGARCSQANQCASGHCQNGYCCQSGDCCSEAIDCGADYRSAPQCITPETCQGQRTDATCTANRCDSVAVNDDSGCTAESFSLNCLTYPDVACNGQVEQTTPECRTSCISTFDCKTYMGEPIFQCVNMSCIIDINI